MLEKKYLEVSNHGVKMGAFENVRNVVETEDSISFDSDDGTFTYVKGPNGRYSCDDNYIEFDSYRVIGRRTLRRETNNLEDVIQGDVSQAVGVEEDEVAEIESSHDNVTHSFF